MTAALYQPFPMIGRARAQIWRYAPQYRRPRHFHAELEMNLVTAGRGSVGVGGQVLTVAAGDLLSWPPGVDHELLDASADFELYVVGATPELSARALGPRAPSAYGGPVRLALAPEALTHVRERCAVPPGDGGSTVATETALGDLWRDLQGLRASAGGIDAVARRVVTSVQAEAHLGRNRLARMVCAHPTEVSKHFHRGVGLTLTAYRTRVRILRFVEHVDRGANLMSAALDAGFGSYSQCHRAFRSVLGCAPREFFKVETRRRVEESFEPTQGCQS